MMCKYVEEYQNRNFIMLLKLNRLKLYNNVEYVWKVLISEMSIMSYHVCMYFILVVLVNGLKGPQIVHYAEKI